MAAAQWNPVGPAHRVVEMTSASVLLGRCKALTRALMSQGHVDHGPLTVSAVSRS